MVNCSVCGSLIESRQFAVVVHDEVIFVGSHRQCEDERSRSGLGTIVQVDAGTCVGDDLEKYWNKNKIQEASDAEKQHSAFGGFSDPSKMPGKSIGYPAGPACPTGCKLGTLSGSVCSKCYAQRGNYVFKNVKQAQDRRFKKLKGALGDTGKAKTWVEGLSGRIGALRVPYFRWHDSGDIQNLKHLKLMVEVAKNTPNVRHWVPTKELATVKKYMGSNEIPENMNIRISAPMIGQRISPGGILTSSSVSDHRGRPESKFVEDPGFKCPATYEHDRPEATAGKCMECRACWSRSVKNVDYDLH
jgi:hypothetical protein